MRFRTFGDETNPSLMLLPGLATEMFRVMGKRRPQLVVSYLPILQELSEKDPNPVVRIHSAGAIRITNAHTL